MIRWFVICIGIVGILLFLEKKESSYSNKKILLILTGVLGMSALIFSGYRPTAQWASYANGFVKMDSALMNESSKGKFYFHTYYDDDEMKYVTSLTEKKFLGFVSRVSQYTLLQSDSPIETVAFFNYFNDNGKLLHYIYLKRHDQGVESVVFQDLVPINFYFDDKDEIIVVLEDIHSIHNMDITALNSNNEPVYYYGYPKGVNSLALKDLKWHEIN